SPAMKARTGTSRNSGREMPLPAMEPRTTVQPSDAAVVRTDVPLRKKPARVLHQPGATLLERLAKGPVKVGFDFPTTLQGSTAHFNVYYDPALGTTGQTIAEAVLASCERE